MRKPKGATSTVTLMRLLMGAFIFSSTASAPGTLAFAGVSWQGKSSAPYLVMRAQFQPMAGSSCSYMRSRWEICNTSHICFGLRVLCMSARHKLLFCFNNCILRTFIHWATNPYLNLVNNTHKYKKQGCIYGAHTKFSFENLNSTHVTLAIPCEYKL